MLEPELRQPVEVWLAMDNDGVGVRLYSQDNRLADAYRAGAPSLDAAQGEITAHYTNVVTPLMASGARGGPRGAAPARRAPLTVIFHGEIVPGAEDGPASSCGRARRAPAQK